MKTISKAGKDLMFSEPFYGFYLLHLNKRFSDKVPTAGVYLSGINTGLDINKEFWYGLKENERVGILKHELLHICFFHLENRDGYPDHQLFNIAADIEINQYIKNNDTEALPEGALNLNMFPTIQLDKFKGTRYYYDKLKENLNKPRNPKSGQGQSQKSEGDEANQSQNSQTSQSNSDGQSNGNSNSKYRDEVLDKLYGQKMHETWKDFESLSDAEKKLVKKQVDHILKEAAKVTKKSQGNIPGELKQYIEELLEVKETVFDWKGYLRRFMGGSQEIFTKKSRRKLSRRFVDNPGLKIKKKKHILVAIDTSGSINEYELGEFFSEVYHIHKTGAEITIIECDARIGDIYKYNGKFRGHITGGGGTSFDPVVEYYNDNNRKYTSLIYFTDGYAGMPRKPFKQMMWVISSNGSAEYAGKEGLPGIVIKIPPTNGKSK